MPRRISDLARVFAAVLVAGVLASPAAAVVISTTSDVPNVRAPANDPGWLNVGAVEDGSAVYLGRGWVITAEHVDGNGFRLSDGRSFTASADYHYRVKNPGFPAGPDLRLFRLTQDPGLPALSISPAAPTVSTQVMMIGSGQDRASQVRGWSLSQSAQGVQWTDTLLPFAHVLGHTLVDTSTKRWGLNVVSGNSSFRTTDFTQVFTTTFDRDGITFEAQATSGDSGGGVFIGSDGGWQLAGLMISSQPLANQPAGIVTYGSQTAMADLAFYRDDILSMVNRSSWQNFKNRFDVNANVESDGRVNSRDALAVINELLRRKEGMDLSTMRADGQFWYDVNGDERGNSQDVLALFNEIRRLNGLSSAAGPLAEPMGALATVPEPSSWWLAALGAAALFAAQRQLHRRPRAA